MCSSVQALLRMFRFRNKLHECLSKWFTCTASDMISLKQEFKLRHESRKYLYNTSLLTWAGSPAVMLGMVLGFGGKVK